MIFRLLGLRCVFRETCYSRICMKLLRQAWYLFIQLSFVELKSHFVTLTIPVPRKTNNLFFKYNFTSQSMDKQIFQTDKQIHSTFQDFKHVSRPSHQHGISSQYRWMMRQRNADPASSDREKQKKVLSILVVQLVRSKHNKYIRRFYNIN